MPCGCNDVPTDYSHGYPPHRKWRPDPQDPDLVARGYQDSNCMVKKIAALGRDDSHKLGMFYPGEAQGNCQVPMGSRHRKNNGLCARKYQS